MGQTEKEKAMELLGAMDKKHIDLKVSKLKWTTQPSGGDLEHVLNITINMSGEDRADVEDLTLHYWQMTCTLGGTKKPEQVAMFEAEGFGETGEDKELSD